MYRKLSYHLVLFGFESSVHLDGIVLEEVAHLADEPVTRALLNRAHYRLQGRRSSSRMSRSRLVMSATTSTCSQSTCLL